MPIDDEEARKARARRLREQVAEIKGPQAEADSCDEAEPPPQEPESPRDFIHRRMNELDRKAPG